MLVFIPWSKITAVMFVIQLFLITFWEEIYCIRIKCILPWYQILRRNVCRKLKYHKTFYRQYVFFLEDCVLFVVGFCCYFNDFLKFMFLRLIVIKDIFSSLSFKKCLYCNRRMFTWTIWNCFNITTHYCVLCYFHD